MITIPVAKNAKHFERTINGFVYRYGYRPIPDNPDMVYACVEQTRTKMSQPVIRKKVEDYCAEIGIENEFISSDYGF